MARVVRFHRTGGPEVLRIEDLEVGDPGPGEVQIRVKAIGLNRAEAMFRSGRVPRRAASSRPASATRRPASSRCSAPACGPQARRPDQQ